MTEEKGVRTIFAQATEPARKGRRSKIVLTPFSLLLVSCANERVTYANYERLAKGMAMEEVEAVLGKPSRRHHHDYYYEGKYGTIKIEVKKDSVHEKSWKDKR